MLLIITATVNPPKQDLLKINSIEERITQYKDSLSFFIKCEAFDKIILCDNSNYILDNYVFEEEEKLAKRRGVNLELISFCGDVDKVKNQGKGYGEGEIMEYLLKNSKLVNDEEVFFKITGRLKVDNILKIINRIKNHKICYINVPNHVTHEMYDTRFYCMPIGIFKNYFIHEYKKVNDKEKYYLETLYTDILKSNHIKHRNFPLYPRIVGISGTSGSEYVYTEWKSKIKDFLSYFNYYGK